MLWHAGWLRSRGAERGTRLHLAGAVAGAIIMLGFTIAGRPILPLLYQGTDAASVERNAAVGDCLTWTRPDSGDLREISCAQAHLFEVTGVANVAERFAPNAPFPDHAAWQKVAQTDCTTSAATYLGKLDPYGKYTVGALKPTPKQWGDGDRTLHCGLQSATTSGQLVATSGSARGRDQSDIYPTGTCLSLDGKVAGAPTPCTGQHAYEIVGVVDLRDQFPNGYPPVDQQQAALARLCGPLTTSYTGGADLARLRLALTWGTIQQQSWDAGSTKVNCEVGALLPDGSGLSPITNSIRGIGNSSSSPPPTG